MERGSTVNGLGQEAEIVHKGEQGNSKAEQERGQEVHNARHPVEVVGVTLPAGKLKFTFAT